MNKHYTGSTFNFVLDKIDRTTNSNWFRSATSGSPLQTAMKKALHTGDAKVLNVYTVGFKGSGLLGYATWPWDYSKNPVDDGVVILYSSIPGGSTANFNEGKTLTHEVGHWLGVYHVFDDLQRSCDDTDYVSDTPAQKTPTNGCPTSKDSCPTKPGLDSIHNYMDYSYDPCMNAFTPGQIDRMKKQSFTYRGLVATSLVSTATLDTVLVPASPIPPPEIV
ncbi:hypothetical protein FRC18_006763 [Serendipita sp. 400]|nr:hypothetical protein FRC18_006763 [Serendipita sp. 400]